MAYFYRLIFCIALFIPLQAFADYSVDTPYGGLSGSTRQSACSDTAFYLKNSRFIGTGTGTVADYGAYGFYCEISGDNAYRIIGSAPVVPTCVAPQVLNAAGTACITPSPSCLAPNVLDPSGMYCILPVPQCPAGSTNVGGTCACAAPNIMQGSAAPGGNGFCATPLQVCQDEARLSNTWGGSYTNEVEVQSSSLETAPQSGTFVCVPTNGFPANQGCTAQWETSVRYQKANSTTWLSYGTAVRGNETTLPCTGGGTDSENKPTARADPVTCKGGQQGEVNGVSTCIPFLPSTRTDSVRKGNESSTDSNGHPLSVEREVNTTCQHSVCTTTTTTRTTSTVTVGGVSTTNTTTATGTVSQPKADYCTKNPKLPECGQSGDGGSSFGGSCEVDFVCDGDGLMCAMAKEQYKRNCELFVNKTPESDAYETAKGLDKEKPVMEPTDVTISSASFNTSNALGGGAGCIADKTVTVAGKSVAIPFSMICQYLEHLGSVLMMVSFLMAIRIVSRG